MFLADERVDMNALARRLGISRATLYRRAGSREQVLDDVLGGLAADFLAASREDARDGPDPVSEVVRAIVAATSRSQPLRGFFRREPELALRLVVGAGGTVRSRLLDGFAEVIAEAYPDEANDLHGFCAALVEMGVSLEWATLVAGDEPSPERIARMSRALLAGARAGELPAW